MAIDLQSENFHMDKFVLTTEFQDLVLACLLRHPSDMLKYDRVLNPKYFSGVYATEIARCTLDYIAKYDRTPSWAVLGQLVEDAARRLDVDSDSAKRETNDYIQRLREMETGDVEYVAEKTVEFARTRAVINAIRRSAEALQDGKEHDYVKAFEDALSVGMDIDDLGVILNDDAEWIVDQVTSHEFGISTGFNLLDSVWRNGMGEGWLVVPVAPPKSFKTGFCVNVAVNVASQSIGHDVIYYTCEISQTLGALRAMTALSGIPSDHVYEAPERFKRTIRTRIDEHLVGNILFKEFPAKTATMRDLESHYKVACKTYGLRPRLVVVDYADTMRPMDTGQSEHKQAANIYTDGRAFATRHKFTMLMPDRCTADTVGKAVPNLKSFQGAFEKGGIVDAAIGLCSTEEERLQNIMRYFFFVNRHGQQFKHFQGTVDPETMLMTVDEEIEYVPEEEQEASSRGRRRGRSRGRDQDELPEALVDE